MNNWFQTDVAYRLMDSCQEDMSPVRVQTDGCACIAAVMGPWFAHRAVVQGGVQIDNKDGLQSLLQRLKEQCLERHCVYIELRNFTDYTATKLLKNSLNAIQRFRKPFLPVQNLQAMVETVLKNTWMLLQYGTLLK